eukprot:2523750-Rhodomonas_salina.2
MKQSPRIDDCSNFKASTRVPGYRVPGGSGITVPGYAQGKETFFSQTKVRWHFPNSRVISIKMCYKHPKRYASHQPHCEFSFMLRVPGYPG